MVSIANGTTLSSALGSNVLALQQTQELINQAQLRVATGRRVNSAIDGADNFFTASALSSRASRLNTVLDNITQQVGIIQQTNDAVSSLRDLVEQIQTVASDAQGVLTENPPQARITGDRNLSAISDLTTLSGISATDRLVFAFEDPNGTIDSGNIVSINIGESADDIIDEINAITNSNAVQVFEASLNSAGQLTIATQDNTRFEIEFRDNGGGADNQLAAALGFNDFDITTQSDGSNETRITVSPTPALSSVALFDQGTNATATASTSLVDLTDNELGALGDIFNGDGNDALNIAVDGGSAIEVVDNIATATVQDLLDGINNNGSLNTKIQASFDAGQGELTIRAISNSVETIQFELEEDNAGAGTAGKIDLQTLGFGIQVLQSGADGSGNISSESFLLGPGVAELADLEAEFDNLRTQLDELVADSEFENKNLLQGDDVSILFNETGSSSLDIEGESFSASSLGIDAANFGTTNTIDTATTQATNALARVESFANGLANDLAVIDTREDFIGASINTLNGNADDLTNADVAQEEALLLTLQARQQLGVFALSLGAQSQLSTLRFF